MEEDTCEIEIKKFNDIFTAFEKIVHSPYHAINLWIGYFIFIISFLLLYFLITHLFLPEQYSFLTHSISAQGLPSLNPTSAQIFNIGSIVFGFIKIPLTWLLFEGIRLIINKLAIVSFIFDLIGTLGMSFVGIFPLYQQRAHAIVATLAFLGYYVAININMISIFVKIIKKSSFGLKKFGWVGFISIFNLAYLNMLLTRINPLKVNIGHRFLKYLLEFPFWEWFSFISIVLSTTLLFIQVIKLFRSETRVCLE